MRHIAHRLSLQPPSAHLLDHCLEPGEAAASHHAFGFERADTGQAAIEVQRQCRGADGRGLSGSRSRDRLGDGRTINGDWLSHRVRSYCVAVG